MNIRVSELLVKYLEMLGTEYVFGIPGAHILPVYDALYESRIKSILAKHEQGAAFMAGGYARASGKPGVCIATAGPGATNLVTGLANAYMDSLPVLALTGETPTYSFGKGALQESSGEGTCINQRDLFRGVTKYNSLVQRTDYLLTVLRKTTGLLLSKNPGPVLLSLPYNLLKETIDSSLLDHINFDAGHSLPVTLLPADEIAGLINNAEYPVVIAGYGSIASGAEKMIADFCVQTNIPVATTLKARGILPETSDLSLGVLGITSNELAFRYITEKADLLIISGASFGERTSYNWNNELIKGKKIIQIDNNENHLNKVFTADIALDADVKKVFDCLIEKAENNAIRPKDPAEISHYKAKHRNHDTRENEFLLVSHFLNMLNDHFEGDVSIFDDNIIYMQRFCHILKSRSYFPNSGISSLGQALPAAIGARLATDNPVIALLGDGGFQMCCMEIMTAVNHNIPVTTILLNNSSLGLVRKNQFYNYAGRFISSEFINPDYRKLAQSFNIEYFRVSAQEEVATVLKTVDFGNRINLIELTLDKDEFPQIFVGKVGAALRENELFNTLNIFFGHFQGMPPAETIYEHFLSCLRDLEDNECLHEQRDPLRAVYEMALRFLERKAAENGFEKGLLFLQRDLYKELEYILSSGQNDTRHDFLVVIPVADRPMMLKNCLESLVEQCRIFQYGGFTTDTQGRPVYHKISAIIVDDSKDEDNRGKIRDICAENVAAGIRTYYVGLEEQTELLRRVPPEYQKHLQPLIGESCGPVQSHKGASISRNIAYLYLHAFLGGSGEKPLIYFLDSDEEFRVKIKRSTAMEDIPFINYFYWLDRIFDAGEVEIVTGKVVGDPPVSPAIMINTFLEDITLFIETISRAAPDGKCIFHDDEPTVSSSAEYHDMVKLFGYNRSPLPKKYECSLSGDHSTQDCLLDFSKRTLGFFYGLHPTRTQLYLHKGDFTETENARTVYTGNYVFKASGLRHFIPFADLKLRMAGPALGRILRKRLKRGFVSANLPLLHKRTFQSDYSNEFRSGISTANDAIDLSLESNRQFWGDVMLFSIEELAELGYPDKRLGIAGIGEIANDIQTKLWNLYKKQQTEIAEKICRIENSLSHEKYWRDSSPEGEDTVQNLRNFCSLVNNNFGVNSVSLEKISEQIREGSSINMIINAIHSFYETDIAWNELLKSDFAVTANCGDIDATIPGR